MNSALNVFPTEIWEMIVYWVFEMDCWNDEYHSQKVSDTIGLPFQPMVKRMMNQLLPKIKIKSMEKLSGDFYDENYQDFQSPQYIVFYSALGRFCKRIQFQLPSGFIDSNLNEFMTRFKKSTWQELHLAHRRLEVLDYTLDMESENFLLIQEWIQFIYMFLYSNIFPCKAFLKMNYQAHRSLRKQLGIRFHIDHNNEDLDSDDEEHLDLWRSDYLL